MLNQDDQKRIDEALKFRKQEAKAAAARATERASQNPPLHRQNQDEARLKSAHWAMSFTKGLDHDGTTGLVKSGAQAQQFRDAVNGGAIAAFTKTIQNLPPLQRRRKWEAPTAGFVFELQGPDAQAVTMPPAPALNNQDATLAELAFEMAEVYELALLRDVPFSAFLAGSTESRITSAIQRLNALPYAQPGLPKALPDLVTGSSRPRKTPDHGPSAGKLTAQTAFRGSSYGVDVGPYLSQFLLIGNSEGPATTPEQQGKINFGNQFIDQRVRNATLTDWMISWNDWLAVQNGEDTRFNPTLFSSGTRFIHTPRDLATYVHDDALYQAYLNACLILLGMKAPFDPGFAALAGGNIDFMPSNTTGFALFGGPHILSLVTEVATRGLKAVRFQKFQNHLRLRPEALAGRLARVQEIEALPEIQAIPEIAGQFSAMASQLMPVMNAIRAHNLGRGGEDRPLLPMAFQEGSPMHPAYGAGHATVAGACVTVLKAFFNTKAELRWTGDGVRFLDPTDPMEIQKGIGVPVQFVTVDDGARLEMQTTDTPLTLLGELNKLAANISIGRNMAGVHYYSDYYDSLRMGEEIAVGILEEQAHGYPGDMTEDIFKMTLVPYDAADPFHMVCLVNGARVTKDNLRMQSNL